MRKKVLAIFVAFMLMSLVNPAFAKPSGKSQSNTSGGPKERIHAKQAIKRTDIVIKAAQKAALKGGIQTGTGLAVGHQKYAVKLYAEGLYSGAIYHTLRARALATTVIGRNKADRVAEIALTVDEDVYRPKLPPDADLDNELRIRFTAQIPADNIAVKIDLVFNLD